MNSYRFCDLSVGMEESFTASITDEMMDAFHGITKDDNPLHTDETFAKAYGQSGKVVYGMLTASFLSTLAGVYLPGKYSLIQQVEIKFAAPVHVGDTLTVRGKIVELQEIAERFVMKVVITNQKKEKLLRAKMWVGVLNERQ